MNLAKVKEEALKGRHHSAVAPEAAGVSQAYARPCGIGQQPDLRRRWIHAVPRVAAQDCQPELAPGCDVCRSTMLMDLCRTY